MAIPFTYQTPAPIFPVDEVSALIIEMAIPQTQKALVIPAYLEPFSLVTRPVPTPSVGDVLVRVESIGLNPAENHVRKETTWVIATYPALVGTDGAGVVVALEEGVTGFSVGDRVLFQGRIVLPRVVEVNTDYRACSLGRLV